MRASVFYQTAELTKVIFKEKIKKPNRVDPNHMYYKYVTSYGTMKTYRSVWNNFGHYLKEHWNLKDFEKINSEHVEAYFEYKIAYYPSKLYLEKISSAIGKLETALEKYTKQKYGEALEYNFEVRQLKLNHARRLKLVYDGYHSRTYEKPYDIIDNLKDAKHSIAATIQLTGGARAEAVTLIKKDQLKGTDYDEIFMQTVGRIYTKEKGGMEGLVIVDRLTYKTLCKHIELNDVFKIDYQSYADDIRETCKRLNITPEGTHAFRWTFAKYRVRAYQDHKYTYEEALQKVSKEMKHHRVLITEHYLG